MKKIYIMTDQEGVAGVLDFDNWCLLDSRYNTLAKEFLTEEVNAAVGGFFAAGAEEIVVSDGHGVGAIHPHLLDSRVQHLRGWGDPAWPLCLDKSFDGLAFIGQHGKAGSHYSHLAHSQNFSYIDIRINGVSIGEFGQMALCASELGVRTIFGSGDYGFTLEAQALVPGIETVCVKKGTKAITGEDLNAAAYSRQNLGALHSQPKAARQKIRAGAEKAVRRARDEKFGIVPLQPPFELVAIRRPDDKCPYKQIARLTHPASVAGAFNSLGQPGVWKPLAEDTSRA
jgi:D-amino peptidase